jgi:hypothetical protein
LASDGSAVAAQALSGAAPLGPVTQDEAVARARSRFRHLRLPVLLLMALVSGAVVLGCSLPQADATGCSAAPTQMIKEISTHLTKAGHLRNGRVVHQSDGMYFVSAELIPAGQGVHYDGDILTWATTSLAGDNFQSVGTKAQLDSSWPMSPIKVTADGALRSRGCTYLVVGTQPLTKCQQAAAAAGLSQVCSHLSNGR